MSNLINSTISKRISRLLFPLLVCGIVQQIYKVLNGIITGKGLGNFALAIVGGVVSTIFSTFNNFTNGIRTAGMTLISQAYASDNDSFVPTIKKALLVNIALALLFVVFTNLFGYPLLKYLQVPQDILDATFAYFRIYVIGFIPNSISLMIINSLRAIGESKRPTYMLIFTYLINLIVDYIVAIKLHLDTTYLAVSFVITQSIVAIILFIAMNNEYHIFAYKSDKDDTLVKILKIGLPLGITSAFYCITTIMMNAAVNKLGTDVISASSIYYKIENAYWIIFSALAIAMNTMFAMNYGAKDYKSIKKAVPFMMIVCLIVSAIYGLITYTFADILPTFFSNNEVTIAAASSCLKFMAPMMMTYATLEVFSSVKNGLGKTLVPTYLAIIGIIGVRVCYLMFYPNLTTLNAVFFAFPLSWGTNAILNGCYSFYLLKKLKD